MKHLNTTLVAAAMLAVSGSALAQSSGGGFDKPLQPDRRWSPIGPQAQGRTTMIMRQQGDGGDYELKIEGGEMSAKLNGKAVPDDQIRRKGDKVEILNDDGEVATTFQISGFQTGRRGIHDLPIPPQPPTGMAIPMAPAAPLKVMLGIRMSVPGDELREELELDEGEGVLVEEVIDDQPAENAGLRAGDVIIEFDGESPVSAETIREVLESKDVGDTVNVTVRRDGQSKRFRVKLAKYDPSTFGMPGMPFGVGGNFEVLPVPGMDEEAMKKLMEEHMKQFRGGQGGVAPRVWGPGGEDGMQFFVPGTGDAATRAKLEQLETRMKELDKKLQRLNQQLERLEKQLDDSGN